MPFNTNVEDGRYKHSGSYSILKEQRGEEVHLRRRFWTENLALISIMIPSGVFPITFLLMLTAASSSEPLRKMFYLTVNSQIKEQFLASCCKFLDTFSGHLP